MSTLLLNASFEPLKVISTRHAVVMVVTDKAEILEAGEGEYRSPSISVPVPDVVRLTRFRKVPFRATIPLTNPNVLLRDKYVCAYTGSNPHTCKGRATSVDHVKPRALGGRHRWENVVAACDPCNHTKADIPLSVLGWSLDFEPHIPKGNVWVALGKVPKPSWEPYLNPA